MGCCSSAPGGNGAQQPQLSGGGDTSTGVTRHATSRRKRCASTAADAGVGTPELFANPTPAPMPVPSAAQRTRLLNELYHTDGNRFEPLDSKAEKVESDPALRLHEQLRYGTTWSLSHDDLDDESDVMRSDALWLANEAAKSSSGGVVKRGSESVSDTTHQSPTAEDGSRVAVAAEAQQSSQYQGSSSSESATTGADAYLAHPHAPEATSPLLSHRPRTDSFTPSR